MTDMRMTGITTVLTVTSLLTAGLCHAQQPLGQVRFADGDRIRAILLSPGTAVSASDLWRQQGNGEFAGEIASFQADPAATAPATRSSYAVVGAIIGGVPLGLLAYGFTRGVCDGGCTGEAVRWGIGAAAVGATLGAIIGSGIERR